MAIKTVEVEVTEEGYRTQTVFVEIEVDDEFDFDSQGDFSDEQYDEIASKARDIAWEEDSWEFDCQNEEIEIVRVAN